MVRVESVFKSYKGNPVLKGASFSAEPGEIITVSGVSGAGKTTLLRMIAGFDLPDSGDIFLNGRSVCRNYMPPHRRGIGFTFQGNALFPCMNTVRNIEFPLHRWSKRQIAERRGELIEAMGLAGLERNNPSTLSGGQAKRVELARALAAKPDILLLDEPLSNIEQKLKGQILNFIMEDRKKSGAVLIYVSHDGWELERVGGRRLQMEGGLLLEEFAENQL